MSGALALVSIPAFAFALAFASASVFRLGLVHLSSQPLYLYGILPLLLSSSHPLYSIFALPALFLSLTNSSPILLISPLRSYHLLEETHATTGALGLYFLFTFLISFVCWFLVYGGIHVMAG